MSLVYLMEGMAALATKYHVLQKTLHMRHARFFFRAGGATIGQTRQSESLLKVRIHAPRDAEELLEALLLPHQAPGAREKYLGGACVNFFCTRADVMKII